MKVTPALPFLALILGITALMIHEGQVENGPQAARLTMPQPTEGDYIVQLGGPIYRVAGDAVGDRKMFVIPPAEALRMLDGENTGLVLKDSPLGAKTKRDFEAQRWPHF